MASYNELNALIDAYINRNGVQAITGQILNGVLKAMVEQLGRGYTIMGAAIPSTDPGTPDGPECYFASETGTYTDFGGLQIITGELALLCYTPSDGWTKATIYEGFQDVQATIDGNVGTPSVGVSYANGVLSFDFRNMKGNPGQNGQDGQDGDPAGFGTIGADITGGVGTPGVSVESSGPATAKNLQFHFTNLKGETGVTSVVATVDNTTGTPTCTASLSGGVLTLAFTGLKGAQGDTGSSVDYPFTIVNNLTTDDATQALSAAMGVQLESEISQLEAKVDGFDEAELTVANFEIAQGLIMTDGTFAQGGTTNGRFGLAKPIRGSAQIKITANSTGATYYAFLTSNNLVRASQAPLVSGTSLVKVDTSATTGSVDIPAGTEYIYIYASTSNSGTLERFPEEIKLYGTGTGLMGRVSDLENNLADTIDNQFVRVVDADTYKGETLFGYIGLDGNFNSSVSNQYIVLSLSGVKRVNVRANSNGATYFAFLTSSTLTANQQAPFAKKCNLVNLSTGQSSGIVDVPLDATYLYVFISVSADNWARFPFVNLFREHILVDNPFTVIENDFTDTSIFTGLDSTRISADGYSPATGFSNKVTINRLVTADEYTLSYYIKLTNLSSVFCLSSVSSGLSSKSSIVTFDFGTGKIEFHNPSDNGSSMTVVKSSKNIDSVTGNLYRCEVGRRERNVFAAVTNLTTGIRTEYIPTDTSNKGTNYGWFYDNPAFSLISGSVTISKIVETMPTRPFMLFLGDSITAGFGVGYSDCWAKKACEHFGGNSFISARSNGTITEMMKKVIEEVPKIFPKFVVLTIGTNGGDTLQNMSQIRDLIKGFGAIPIINCIYQRSGTSHIETDEAVNDIILSLGCLCSRFDLATSLNNTISSGGNPAYYQSDGLHLNADGNDAVYNRFLSDMSIIYTE